MVRGRILKPILNRLGFARQHTNRSGVQRAAGESSKMFRWSSNMGWIPQECYHGREKNQQHPRARFNCAGCTVFTKQFRFNTGNQNIALQVDACRGRNTGHPEFTYITHVFQYFRYLHPIHGSICTLQASAPLYTPCSAPYMKISIRVSLEEPLKNLHGNIAN